ncbi:hypothetical protein [Cohaesibacter sp. ES.047]|uniref:hypothetical protein n=1 Tax=Cohaesibacter sp. ES.047 TaxID=1798205 RepID=UPI0012FDFDA2|nr:hypothetical protein [Cohaesibacter sp. ES.047]
MQSNDNVAAVRRAFPDFAALTVEKYGVSPAREATDPDPEDCPLSYHAHSTVTQREEDYVRVVEILKKKKWWNGKLVLFGGSEGGSAMAGLSRRLKADAVILLSTGGGATFGEMIKTLVPIEVRVDLDAFFDDVRQNPDSIDTKGVKF